MSYAEYGVNVYISCMDLWKLDLTLSPIGLHKFILKPTYLFFCEYLIPSTDIRSNRCAPISNSIFNLEQYCSILLRVYEEIYTSQESGLASHITSKTGELSLLLWCLGTRLDGLLTQPCSHSEVWWLLTHAAMQSQWSVMISPSILVPTQAWWGFSGAFWLGFTHVIKIQLELDKGQTAAWSASHDHSRSSWRLPSSSTASTAVCVDSRALDIIAKDMPILYRWPLGHIVKLWSCSYY